MPQFSNNITLISKKKVVCSEAEVQLSAVSVHQTAAWCISGLVRGMHGGMRGLYKGCRD